VNVSSGRLGATVFPAAVVGVVALMVIPMPPALLDVLLSINIGASVLLLLAAIGSANALDLSAFPSIILVATLFRLGLNVSSTRLILSEGSAGSVIESFGSIVIGGSLVVGLVVFFILVVIQFVVITNGSNRVAEVAARFTLDAMPGKQMAIDADLNAGVIDDDEARRRREETSAEADFYGAMDGAGKFVKGDAIATVVIVAINLVGGLVIGVLQLGMSISEAVENYSILTVGDGLVTQIPALLVSIATGLIVTRAAGRADLGTDVFAQFARQYKAFTIAGAALVVLALFPGMPKVPFLAVGGVLVFAGRRLAARATVVLPPPEPEVEPTVSPDDPAEIARSMRLDAIGLELAVDMVDLVDPMAGGDLLDRVRGLRRKIAQELGLVLPPVRTQDSTLLDLGTYAIRFHGVDAAIGAAPPGHLLVIADDLSQFPGEEIREPVFGLPAKWLPAELRHHAELSGATVVERSAIITTHLAELVRSHAASLLTRQDVKQLVDLVRETDPAVVDELTAGQISTGEVQTVLEGLLAEQVPIRNLARILEVITVEARTNRHAEHLIEACRSALASTICAERADGDRLPVLSLEPLLEHHLVERVAHDGRGSTLAVDPDTGEALSRAITVQVTAAEQQGDRPVLVCSPVLRPALSRFAARVAPQLPVLSFEELAEQFRVTDLGVISVPTPA
jgi:flagellar biosynthesis protein FlhA